jgi:hypothetical protein
MPFFVASRQPLIAHTMSDLRGVAEGVIKLSDADSRG